MRKSPYKYYFLRYFRGINRRLPLKALQKLSGQNCICPFYHTVSDRQLPHIQPLYPYPGTQAFRNAMAFLLKHYRALAPHTFAKQQGCPNKEHAFLVSFDDGLRGIAEYAAPILQQMGIPALFFLNTAFVDNHKLFYKHKAALLFQAWQQSKQLPVHDITQKLNAYGLQPPDDKGTFLLDIPWEKRALLDELAPLLEVDFNRFLQEEQPYLTWSEIQDLHKQGFAFGTHTASHPYLPALSLQEQLQAIHQPFNTLQQYIPQAYHFFSFPFTDDGLSYALFRALHDSPQKHPLFTFAGAGLKKQQFPRHFQRIPMERNGLAGAEIIKGEYFYYLLKSLAGKNTVPYTTNS